MVTPGGSRSVRRSHSFLERLGVALPMQDAVQCESGDVNRECLPLQPRLLDRVTRGPESGYDDAVAGDGPDER